MLLITILGSAHFASHSPYLWSGHGCSSSSLSCWLCSGGLIHPCQMQSASVVAGHMTVTSGKLTGWCLRCTCNRAGCRCLVRTALWSKIVQFLEEHDDLYMAVIGVFLAPKSLFCSSCNFVVLVNANFTCLLIIWILNSHYWFFEALNLQFSNKQNTFSSVSLWKFSAPSFHAISLFSFSPLSLPCCTKMCDSLVYVQHFTFVTALFCDVLVEVTGAF